MCSDSVSNSTSETQLCRFVDSRTVLPKALRKVSLFIKRNIAIGSQKLHSGFRPMGFRNSQRSLQSKEKHKQKEE